MFAKSDQFVNTGNHPPRLPVGLRLCGAISIVLGCPSARGGVRAQHSGLIRYWSLFIHVCLCLPNSAIPISGGASGDPFCATPPETGPSSVEGYQGNPVTQCIMLPQTIKGGKWCGC